MRFFICSNEDEVSYRLSAYLKEKLTSSKKYEFCEENPNIVISIGGDGRFLRTIRKYINQLNSVAFVGLATGKLGFLCEYRHDEVDDLINSMLTSAPHYISHRMVEVKMGNYHDYFLNEVRVERVFHTFICNVKINDIALEKFRGNGLNFSSSIGSTAYNRSLGGPLINSRIPVLIMGEVASINHNSYRNLNSFLVLQDYDKVTLTGDFEGCIIGGDNVFKKIDASLKNKEINIMLSSKSAIFAVYRNSNYYCKLKNSFILD